MKIHFNRKGEERKILVRAIGEILDVKPIYQGPPQFMYQINRFLVDREGTLITDDCSNNKELKDLLGGLHGKGFDFEEPDQPAEESKSDIALVIEIPREGFTENALTNLQKMLQNKGTLINKALGVPCLPIEITNETIRFPWFSQLPSPDEITAFTHFIALLSQMAKRQQRVNEYKQKGLNEKFAFRIYLIRLGFVGPEYRNDRKILLSRLNGNSAYKDGRPSSRTEGME